MINLSFCSGPCLSFFVFGLAVLLMPKTHADRPSASATIEAIRDPALRMCVQKALPASSSGSLDEITELKCHNQGVESVAGLEHLAGLRKLSLFRNRIRQFDVALPQSLESLNLARNQLDSLTLSQLPHLRELYVFGNRLKRLELHHLPELTSLRANDNRLTLFKYQELEQMEKIYLFNNQLETLDIYHLPAMRYMDCRQNPMPDELYDEMDRLEQVTFLHDGNADDW